MRVRPSPSSGPGTARSRPLPTTPTEPAYRGKHLAREALSLLLHYATAPPPAGLGVARENLIARIGTGNAGSVRLFETLGFALSKRIEVFGQDEYRSGWKREGKGEAVRRDEEGMPRGEWMMAGRLVEYKS